MTTLLKYRYYFDTFPLLIMNLKFQDKDICLKSYLWLNSNPGKFIEESINLWLQPHNWKAFSFLLVVTCNVFL